MKTGVAILVVAGLAVATLVAVKASRAVASGGVKQEITTAQQSDGTWSFTIWFNDGVVRREIESGTGYASENAARAAGNALIGGST